MSAQLFPWGSITWIHEPHNPDTDRMSAGYVTFFPGGFHETHVHSGEEQIIYVISGTGEHIVNGLVQPIKPGDLIYFPPYSNHTIRNASDKEILNLLTVYAPSRPIQGTLLQPTAITSKYKLTDLVPLALLEEIQQRFASAMQLAVCVLDHKKRMITASSNYPSFCQLLSGSGRCPFSDTYTFSVEADTLSCRWGIVKVSLAVAVTVKPLGFIEGGYLRLNPPGPGFEDALRHASLELGIPTDKLIEGFQQVPLVPKSRLYAVKETIKEICDNVKVMATASLVQQELDERNRRLVKEIKEKSRLESTVSKLQKLFTPKLIPGGECVATPLSYPFQLEKHIITALQQIDLTEAGKHLNEFSTTLASSTSFDTFKRYHLELAIAIIHAIDIEPSIQQHTRSDFLQKVQEASTMTGVQSVLEKLLSTVVVNISHRGVDDPVNLTKSIIQQRYSEQISLSNIARVIGFSPNYLCRVFKKNTGITVTRYLNQVRVGNAQKLLATSDKSIRKISREVGFPNQSYFSHIFKEVTGISPQEYRNSIQDTP
ncbi:MAG: AraC family transcriptional regulator [Gammaproteobacteria bacterium]|nr:AraC family transcriptional regulator [Gammaproteobacteria bacterium]